MSWNVDKGPYQPRVNSRPMQELDQVKFDSVDSVNLSAEGSKYVVVDTRTDNFDKAKAKSNAEDSMISSEKLMT